MNKTYAANLAKIAHILKAYGEGKTIQTRRRGTVEWYNWKYLQFDEYSVSEESDMEYRIKPCKINPPKN